MSEQAHGGWDQIGRGISALLGAALAATPQWAELHAATTLAERDHTLLLEIRRLVMALTQNEQRAVNDLAETVVTLSGTTDTLATDLGAAQTAAQIAAMQAAADTIENDVVGALSPLTASMTDVNSRLTAIDSNLKNPQTPLTPTA
jgi:outer membrane murein-binding lipoprotein Lpp